MAIAITIKSPHCCNILNGIKKGEIRKNENLHAAIEKAIAEKGKATIYVICSKSKPMLFETYGYNGFRRFKTSDTALILNALNGKVVCKFECEKVEELYTDEDAWSYYTDTITEDYKVSKIACVDDVDIEEYLNGSIGYFIHISNLKVFEEPKELKELKHWTKKWIDCGMDCPPYVDDVLVPLTKAPQNFCYVEDTL